MQLSVTNINFKHRISQFIFLILLLSLYYLTNRAESTQLLALFFGLFTVYLYFLKSNSNLEWLNFGLICRASLLFALPNLSDDFYRFLWDGHLINQGINPFNFLPSQAISSLEQSEWNNSLLNNMNSPEYFTLYPPLNQWIFSLGALTQNTFWGVFIFKIILLGFDFGNYWIIKKILVRFSKPTNWANLYWLNPLIILEGVGNVHFEIMMLFFFLSSTYYLATIKDQYGGLSFTFSILSKMFILMMAPLTLLKLGWHRSIRVIPIMISVFLLSFLPFINWNNIGNMMGSINLYFQKFEFNSGIYSVIKYIGFNTVGYDVIQLWGPILAIISTLIILVISFNYRYRNRLVLFTGYQYIFITYLLFSPIGHPWYLIIPIALSVFTKKLTPIIWSAFIFLSYTTYGNVNFEENSTLLIIEYTLVFTFLIIDVFGDNYKKIALLKASIFSS